MASTCSFVLGVVGKGSTSSPGKIIKKKKKSGYYTNNSSVDYKLANYQNNIATTNVVERLIPLFADVAIMCMFVYGSVLIGFGLLLFPVNVFHELIKIKSNQHKAKQN